MSREYFLRFADRKHSRFPESDKNQDGSGAVCDIGRGGDSRNPHPESAGKKQIESDIYPARKGQRKKRKKAFSPCAKRSRAEVVKQQKRVSRKIYAQISSCLLKNSGRRVYQPQKRAGNEESEYRARRADRKREHKRGRDRFGESVSPVFADSGGDEHIHPDGKPGGKGDYQRHRFRIRPDGCEGVRAAEMPCNCRVGGVEKLLYHTAQGNGQRE